MRIAITTSTMKINIPVPKFTTSQLGLNQLYSVSIFCLFLNSLKIHFNFILLFLQLSDYIEENVKTIMKINVIFNAKHFFLAIFFKCIFGLCLDPRQKIKTVRIRNTGSNWSLSSSSLNQNPPRHSHSPTMAAKSPPNQARLGLKLSS